MPRRKNLTPDDREAWRDFARKVEPLSGRTADDETPAERQLAPKRRSVTARPRAASVQDVRPSPLPELAAGDAPGLDKRSMQRLRRGQYPIEGKLDLHGMGQVEAQEALNRFLAGSLARGRRCVLIVTGKGLKRDGTIGVLRRMVPLWLNLSPNRERVLGFTTAQPGDGGDGALYVLMRRERGR